MAGESVTSKPASGLTFVVTHTWPEIRNAEYEVLQRLSIAASNVGATMIAVDNDGRPLWANSSIPLDASRPVRPDEIDFMISLHFESPRLIDVYSYYALWQPLDFYFQFGYGQSLQKMLTHNDCLSCLSDFADAHGRTTFGARGGLNPEPFPTLFHCVPQPYLEPRIDERSRLFYIGINWERLGKTKGRHAGVFDRLDGDDVLDIYGPEKLLGVAPWEGFQSYRGELPFDGLSTVNAINKAGICLALSSDAHKRSGLMSNRLFEGLAAGAAVIVDSNRFAKTHFSDIAYFIDDSGSEEEVTLQIKGIVEEIRRSPDKAIERVRRGQALLAERFSLEGSLRRLAEVHPKRLQHYRDSSLGVGSVGVIITYLGDSAPELLEMIAGVAAQSMVSTKVALICDAGFFASHGDAISAAATSGIQSLTPILSNLQRCEREAGQPPPQTAPTGPRVAEALAALDTDYFCFLRQDEIWFRDHLASLVGALQRAPGAAMSVSGALEQDTDQAKTTRSLASLRFAISDAELLNARYASEYGRFLFSRTVIDQLPMDCLSVLDGQEPNLVRLVAALDGDPAQTGYATYVRDRAKTEALPGGIIPEEQQQQFIRDSVAFNGRWLARMTSGAELPQHIYAYSRGAPVRFDHFQQPLGVTRNLPVDLMVDTRLGADGLRYLEHGFSLPEKEGSWVEAAFGAIEFFCSEKSLDPDQDYDLALVMRGRAARDTGRPQHCTVVLNGVAVGYVEVPEHPARFSFRLPRKAFTGGRLRVQLIPDHAELVYDENGKLVDDRRLSLHVRQFGLVSRRVAPRPTLTPQRLYEMREGADGLAVLRDGFSLPEAASTWLVGRRAQLGLQVQGFAPPMDLLLWLTGRPTNEGRLPQSVAISVNGVSAGSFALEGGEVELCVPLSGEVVGADGVCAVTLEFAHAEPVLDENGGVVDSRLLAAQLHRIRIVGGTPLARRLRKLEASARKAWRALRGR